MLIIWFTKKNICSQIAEISSTTMMVVFTIACIFGTLFIDRFPRRILIFIFGGLSYLFLLMFVVCSAIAHSIWWMKYASLGFMASYCVSFGYVGLSTRIPHLFLHRRKPLIWASIISYLKYLSIFETWEMLENMKLKKITWTHAWEKSSSSLCFCPFASIGPSKISTNRF